MKQRELCVVKNVELRTNHAHFMLVLEDVLPLLVYIRPKKWASGPYRTTRKPLMIKAPVDSGRSPRSTRPFEKCGGSAFRCLEPLDASSAAEAAFADGSDQTLAQAGFETYRPAFVASVYAGQRSRSGRCRRRAGTPAAAAVLMPDSGFECFTQLQANEWRLIRKTRQRRR